MKCLILISAMLMLSLLTPAQEIKWKTAPYKGFVYEISNREAYKLLTGKIGLTKDLLHSRIDTFCVDKGWTNRPNHGHFILVTIAANKLHCEYTCVMPYQVFLFREYNTLSLQVLDLDGNVREDAKVYLQHQRIKADSASRTYRIDDNWIYSNDPVASVEFMGFRSFYSINKNDPPTWTNYGNWDDGPSFYSYLITDKNLYKPGEKVRYKSYALTGGKTPMRKALDIVLSGNGKHIKMGTIMPYHPGGYAGEFVLADSLKLNLDRNYTLELKDNWRTVSSCSFRYEEYELTGNKLNIKLERNLQYYPDSNKLYIRATDANSLQLKDVHATVIIKTRTILETFRQITTLSDTLLYTHLTLPEDGPAVIVIPPELFKKTNTSFEVSVLVSDAENHLMTSETGGTYFYKDNAITCSFRADSIRFEYLHNNISQCLIPATLVKDNNPDTLQITLPYMEKLNPANAVYHLEAGGISNEFLLTGLNHELRINGGIQKDSFAISLYNPRRLDVTWYIYQGSELIEMGFGKDIRYTTFITDRTQTYYAEVIYSFGGKDHVIRKSFEFRDDFLNVNLKMPDQVYPGQQVDAVIEVTDQLGKPVRNVDLTALAVNSELNYNLPDLPYYGTNSSPRPMGKTFNKSPLGRFSVDLPLDCNKWIKGEGFDTMLYYQFTYPGSLFKFETDIADSTQFAPFVMQNGEAQQIQVIEVDHVPVYFSWTKQLKKYSFYVSPCRPHTISLRLADKIIIMDSVIFENNKKTIFSLNPNHLPKKTLIRPMKNKLTTAERLNNFTLFNSYSNYTRLKTLENKLTTTEKDRYSHYIAAIRTSENTFAYLEAYERFVPLYDKTFTRYGFITAGPIDEGMQTFARGDQYRISYRHQGNYNYEFSDNIVYKTESTNIIPDAFFNYAYNPMGVINDKALNKEDFLELQHQPILPELWTSTTIDIKDPYARLRIGLSALQVKGGIATVVFRNAASHQTMSPAFTNKFIQSNRSFIFPAGYQSVMVVFNNGSYLKADSVLFAKSTQTIIDFKNSTLNEPDSASMDWIDQYAHYDYNYFAFTPSKPAQTQTRFMIMNNSNGDVTGIVKDADTNEPLPGASVVIKGTMNGAVTDVEGRFSIDLDNYFETLVFSFIGYIEEEVDVTRGSEINISLKPDILALEEVVVVGYGTQMRSEVTGAISVIRGISTIESNTLPESPETLPESRMAEEKLYNDLLQIQTIRSHFSDVGFWQPALYTDRKGEACFTVTFPDDITRWDATVYAMNRHLKTRTFRKSIKAYKPIMAQLNVPQFLTKGDSVCLTGQIQNYSKDSLISGTSTFVQDSATFSNAIRFSGFYNDSLWAKAGQTDTMVIRYSFKRDDNYYDGEERKIPVVDLGITRADGSLEILKNGDQRSVIAGDNETLTVSLMNSPLDVYRNEIYRLYNYRYACNEQLASRLVGLINAKLLCSYEQNTFRYEKELRKIIDKLLSNMNAEFLWSWWDKSDNTSYWVSAHVLRALKYAQTAGYPVDLDIANLTRKAQYKFEFLKQISFYDVDFVHALSDWNAPIDYARYIPMLDSLVLEYENLYDDVNGFRHYYNYSVLKEKLELQEIRQMQNLNFQPDTLMKYKKEGILGELFFSDGKIGRYWYTNEMEANVIAYRIIRNDSSLHDLITPMQLYFLNTRRSGEWNTYESSNILMNIFPDILTQGTTAKNPATVIIKGKDTLTVNNFPFNCQLSANEQLQLEKTAGLPIYLMKYKMEKVITEKTGVEGFSIKTSFSKDMPLKAGIPVNLSVEVVVKKNVAVDNVMIEVPIPGGCSYADKNQLLSRRESHREYFKEKTSIFCERLEPGKHIFNIVLIPRFTGKFMVNPARVSLMYIPVVNANTSLKKLSVINGTEPH